ncbi:unnamed protein product [Caenorhabditis brenneri]
MRIISRGPNKEDKIKLDSLIKDVNTYVKSFVEQVDDLQQYVAELFIREFGENGPIDLNSLNKLARITSHYASSEVSQKLGRYQRAIQKLFTTWQSLRTEALECTNREKEQIAVIPAKMSFFYFYNGELCKAVVCLLDYVELVPEDVLTMEATLRWLMFLGETELAEKKMKQWKTEKSSEDIFKATRIEIGFLKHGDDRVELINELIALRDRIKAENIRSFPRYELASYVAWLCSTLSNSAVGASLTGLEFPDRLSQVQEAVNKAESIVRNRIPGLAAYQFDNSVNTSIWPFLEGSRNGSSNDYIHLGSTLAWYFEMRRELALVNVATAQTRDSMSSMILNLRIALKSASFFRILQTTNLLAYYTALVEEVGSERNAKLMRVSCFNLLSSEPVIVRCSTPKEPRVPSRAHTPLPGEKIRPQQQSTMIADESDEFEDIYLLEKPFHSITRSCSCTVCLHYPNSSTFAAEYMLSHCIYMNFSQDAIKHFNDEFSRIRERGMEFQLMMHRDRSVRPRPSSIQNEVFGIAVIQWLIRKVDSKELADSESLEIFRSALKVVKYLNLRTTDLLLAVTQLGRQLEFPFDVNYSWMQPIVKKPRSKKGLECAVDLFRAVSPFGRRPKDNAQSKPVPVDKEKLLKMRSEVRREMNNYAHILYREWRCRLFPYIGRISNDPWEAAYAWAESTLIGSRNAIQCKLERCRKGVVTISGPERFKTCVRSMPDDMTLVQIAVADDKKIYLIKLHPDRDPIIMPLAHPSQVIELMDKFSFMLDEDERIAKYPGEMTPEEFWKRRKVVDARMKDFVNEVQSRFLDVAAFLLMPSGRLGSEAKTLAHKIVKLSNEGLLNGEAKELVYLAEEMDETSWKKLILRFCEMRTTDEKFESYLPTLYKKAKEALLADKNNGSSTSCSEKKYTYLVICPHLSQFCWERLPIFDNYPYVGRQVSIHSLFSQLEALRNKEKQIPLQIDVQNAYYVLDPENNLGETKRRMLDYINKFKWEGIVGEAPNSTDISTALSRCDVFFYFGHGSGSSVMPRSVIKQSTCNAISMLMGCGSVRTIPQALGFDGKSTLHDYAMAKCPLIVGCLWTVTDGEIDRFLIRMVDDCFDKTRAVSGIDKLRQLSEAMHEARSKAKLAFLTGAAVVMYGLPVVSKSFEGNTDTCRTPNSTRKQSANTGSARKIQDTSLKTPKRNEPLKPLENSMNRLQVSTPKRSNSNSSKTASLSRENDVTPRQTSGLKLSASTTNTAGQTTPRKTSSVLKPTISNINKTASSQVGLAPPKTPRQVKTFPDEKNRSEVVSKRSTRATKPVIQLVPETPSSKTTRTTRSSGRTPSRSRQC